MGANSNKTVPRQGSKGKQTLDRNNEYQGTKRGRATATRKQPYIQ